MTAKTICIYHDHCADGFTAAWVVRKHLLDIGVTDAEFIAAQYQQEPPDVTGAYVIMVDFSYKREELAKMLEQCSGMLIIDHHKTASPEILAVGPSPKLDVFFDLERSGAGLAWDRFFGDMPRPVLVELVEDRDLWRFKRKGSRELHSVLTSYPNDFDVWDRIYVHAQKDIDTIIEEGAALDRKHLKQVEDAIASASYNGLIAGYTVPILNAPGFMASDAGNIMATNNPQFAFAACWYTDGKVDKYSLRSTPEGADVSNIAKLFGGGGHARAAGFAVPHGTGVALRPGLANAALGGEARF